MQNSVYGIFLCYCETSKGKIGIKNFRKKNCHHFMIRNLIFKAYKRSCVRVLLEILHFTILAHMVNWFFDFRPINCIQHFVNVSKLKAKCYNSFILFEASEQHRDLDAQCVIISFCLYFAIWVRI